MSVKALTWAFDTRAPSPGAKWALVALADSADDDGIVILGRKSLAAKCQVNAATSTAHLKALEKDNLIWRKERRRGNGSRTSDWIVLAPNAADRGPMLDASTEKREDPELLERAQVRNCNPRPGVTGCDLPTGQVGILGGPYDPPEDPSVSTHQALLVEDEDDRRATGLVQWYAAVLAIKRGEPSRVTKPWRAAARRIVVGRSGDEIRAVVEWALAHNAWTYSKAKTLPLMAKNYGDLRGEWQAATNAQERAASYRRDKEDTSVSDPAYPVNTDYSGLRELAHAG